MGGGPIDFQKYFLHTLEVNGAPSTVWLPIFFKIICVQQKKDFTGLEKLDSVQIMTELFLELSLN